MGRGTDPAKLREWAERFRRFEEADQSVTAFCKAESVSQPTFYHWRRRLAAAGRHKANEVARPRDRPAAASSRFQSLLVTPQKEVVGVKIRLPGGAEIELGNDASLIEKIIAQLLASHQPPGATPC
jgi:hypothetical protein